MRKARRLDLQCLIKRDVFGRIGQVVFAPDHVRYFHFDIVDDVNEMEDPGPIRPADGHVGLHTAIELDPATDYIVYHNGTPRRTKADSAFVLIDLPFLVENLEIPLIDCTSLALKVRTELSSFVSAFIPFQPEPAESFVDHSNCILAFTTLVRVLDPEHKD